MWSLKNKEENRNLKNKRRKKLNYSFELKRRGKKRSQQARFFNYQKNRILKNLTLKKKKIGIKERKRKKVK